jgi:hypothetical protein
VKDRISDFKDKVEIKEKTEETLVKQLKSCKRNMQEISNSIKRPNLRIMGTEKDKEVQVKRVHNIFNKIITENFPKLKNVMPIQVQEACRTPKTKLPVAYYHYNKKHREQKKNIEGCKGEKINNI